MQLKRTAQMLGTVQKRQLGRKMQILHKLATCFLCKITDAPHTGARLETSQPHFRISAAGDGPHTGARLETAGARTNAGTWRLCPHTGKRFKIFRAPSGKYARGCPYRLAAFCFTVFALFLNAFLLQTVSGVKAHAFVNADHSLDFLPLIQWLLLTY